MTLQKSTYRGHRVTGYNITTEQGKKQRTYYQKTDISAKTMELKLFGKTTVEAENERIWKKMTIFITEREDIKPLQGMD